MVPDRIYQQIGNVRFKDLVCQKDIKTQKDIEKLQKKSYLVELTAKEFSARFPLLPIDKIFYGPIISVPSLYYNAETLAASSFMVPFLIHPELGGSEFTEESFLKTIEKAENDVKNGNYYSSGMQLPDAAQMEYLNLLSQRICPPNLYDIFLRIYRKSDYGFSLLTAKTMDTIIRSKTAEDKDKTETALKKLPARIKIFRGGNSQSVPYQSAYSWTTDINSASFFAARRGVGPGYIACATIGKEDVIEYFPNSSEKEILTLPGSLSFQMGEEISLKGLAYLEKALPEAADLYHEYCDELMTLNFAMDSPIHGREHEARVLLHCILLGNELKLSSDDLRILCTAAIYHDTGRENDGADDGHGAKGWEYYISNVENPDPFVEFLCIYHSLPDKVGYKRIQKDPVLAKQRDRAKKLLDVFKDADALDRVRFGIQDVDLNQMRNSVSRTMVLVARLMLDNVRL